MRRCQIPRLLFLCGAIQITGWLILTLISLGKWTSGFSYEVPNDSTPTWTFCIIQATLGLVLLGTFLVLKHRTTGYSSAFILVFSIILRLVAIPGEPIHESDFYRYLWDGKVAKAGINPYRFEPGALFLKEKQIDFEFNDESTGVTWRGRNFTESENKLLSNLQSLRDDNPLLFERVSHPAVTTIYPPMAQWIFLLSQWCFGDSIIGLKAIIVLFDIGVVALILSILKRLKRPPLWAILYAWNPLPIKEFANSAHYDAIAIFFMLIAVWFTLHNWPAVKKIILVSVALALGTLAKYFAILLLPVLLLYIHDHQSNSQVKFSRRISNYLKSPLLWSGLITFLFVVGISFYPYSVWNDAGWSEIFRGLSTYQQHWQYSPGLFSLIHLVTGWFSGEPFLISKKLAAIFLCLTVAILALFSQRQIGWKCFAILASLFILSPTAFPWYFCWVLAFIPFQNRTSWLVLSFLLPLNYLDFHSAGSTALANWQWSGFYATQLLSWGIFLITWIGESVRRHFI